ncbi:MAG: hypothetical protein QXG00_00850 [Candidatus Woesearchaeota archaeon]
MGLFSFGKRKKSKNEENDTQDFDEFDEPKEIKINSDTLDLNLKISKLTAQVESLMELRNSYNERFQQFSQQLGEIRMMAMDTNRSVQLIQQTAAKATELIEQVQAEKILMEIAKQEQRLEILKANIETNDSVIHKIIDELKEIRNQMSFYKGTQQVIELFSEMKENLVTMKKIENNVVRHSDKTEHMFINFETVLAKIAYIEKGFEDLQTNIKLFTKEQKEKQQSDYKYLELKVEDLKVQLQETILQLNKRLDKFRENVNKIEF